MKFLTSLFMVFAFSANAMTAVTTCWPTKNLVIPPDAAAGLTKKQFDKTLDDFEKTVVPLVDFEHATLVVNRLWSDDTINANTTENGNTWSINAFGGFARYPNMTPSGYLLVMCHELGHHLGKAPRYNNNTEWAATEGESDYWATLKCMKLFDSKVYSSDSGMITLAKILAILGGEKTPSLNTPDKLEIGSTLESHPPAQCRLDTSKSGQECTASGLMDDIDARIGACFSYDHNKKPVGIGNRPRCWYAPSL